MQGSIADEVSTVPVGAQGLKTMPPANPIELPDRVLRFIPSRSADQPRLSVELLKRVYSYFDPVHKAIDRQTLARSLSACRLLCKLVAPRLYQTLSVSWFNDEMREACWIPSRLPLHLRQAYQSTKQTSGHTLAHDPYMEEFDDEDRDEPVFLVPTKRYTRHIKHLMIPPHVHSESWGPLTKFPKLDLLQFTLLDDGPAGQGYFSLNRVWIGLMAPHASTHATCAYLHDLQAKILLLDTHRLVLDTTLVTGFFCPEHCATKTIKSAERVVIKPCYISPVTSWEKSVGHQSNFMDHPHCGSPCHRTCYSCGISVILFEPDHQYRDPRCPTRNRKTEVRETRNALVTNFATALFSDVPDAGIESEPSGGSAGETTNDVDRNRPPGPSQDSGEQEDSQDETGSPARLTIVGAGHLGVYIEGKPTGGEREVQDRLEQEVREYAMQNYKPLPAIKRLLDSDLKFMTLKEFAGTLKGAQKAIISESVWAMWDKEEMQA